MPYPQFISCKAEQPLQGEELQKKNRNIHWNILTIGTEKSWNLLD